MEKNFMRRLVYIAALVLMVMLVLAPGAMAQQMNHEHMMPNGQMMEDNMMASPFASAKATPSATDNRGMTDDSMMASPSTSASATASTFAAPSTPASASPSATIMASASQSHRHGAGGSSASAAVGGQLPSTGGMPLVSLVSIGVLGLLMGTGLVAAKLLRRST